MQVDFNSSSSRNMFPMAATNKLMGHEYVILDMSTPDEDRLIWLDDRGKNCLDSICNDLGGTYRLHCSKKLAYSPSYQQLFGLLLSYELEVYLYLWTRGERKGFLWAKKNFKN